MRVAVLICGKCPKDYKKYRDSIYNTLIKPYESDVFISTWTDNTYDPSELWSLYKPKRLLIGSMNSIKDKIDKFNEFTKKNGISQVLGSMYPLFYKLYTANQLRIQYQEENNFKYDIIIRTRFDLNFSERMFANSIEPFIFDKIEISELSDAMKNDVVYLKMDPFYDFPTFEWRNSPDYFVKKIDDWIWDSFGFGNDKSMNIYCDTFLNLERIIESKRKDVNVNEKMLYYNLIDNGISIKHTHTTYRISDYQS